ncbi:ubiquitin-specific protease ubp2 [Gryganskiella cystojenkinii]|nr:ubiquitin-specific protease ubp2 [Gryganskiella cystojenkinii]
MMGVDEYLPNGMAKQIDLSNKMALNTERESSFGKLGCLSNMNDDLILDTFQTQVGHDLTKAHVLVDALLEVKKTRNSEKLDFELVRLRSESIVSTMELRAAYRDFEIGESGEGISTEVLIGLLRASIHVGSKPNLEIIIKSRNDLEMSQITEDSFWAEDIPPELEDPILDLYYAQHPVGLANIGNTCYLNSLLQYMYTIRDIRETVMNMDAYLENESDPDWKEKVIDGRTLSRQDVAEAKEIVSELNKLFTSMLTAKSRSVTPSTRLVELLLSTGKDGLTDVTGTRAQDQFFEQQDVSETMSILMLFYAKASKKSSDDKKEMEGQSNNRVIEDFNTLLLNVKEDIAMEELVDNYFDAGNQQQSPDLGGGSASGSTDSNANTNDNVITMTELPPILQIHLMRTQFDRIDKTSYKSNAKVSIPKRLYLDQYLDSFQSGDEVRFKRLRLLKQERRQHRKDLERLLNRRKHSVLSLKRTLPFESEERSSASVLKSPSVPIAGEEELAAMATDSQPRSQSAMDIELTGPARSVTRTDVPHYNDHGVENSDSDTTEQLERKILELNAKIQEEVQGLVTAEYKIHAVFHHEGGANFGHYWVYILDDPAVSAENPEQSQQSQPRWLKYSDDLVSEVGSSQEDEVFNGVEGSTACFCVYVRNNSSDIVQTIVRSIS